MTAYAELAVTSNFSFLRGASNPGDLLDQALALGHAGMGLADRNTVAGVVRAYSALKNAEETFHNHHPGQAFPFRFVAGSRLVFADDTPDVLCYPANRMGWGRLCKLLTQGNLRSAKGSCTLFLDDLLADISHLLLIVMPGRRLDDSLPTLTRLSRIASGQVWLAAIPSYGRHHRHHLARLKALSAETEVPLLACNDVLYHSADQRPLQDVLSCIREKTTIANAGTMLEANAERHLKSPGEMARLFRDMPEALGETRRLLDRIQFSLGELKYDYPDEPVPEGWTAQGWLDSLTWSSAARCYPSGIPTKVKRVLQDELVLIEQLDYARYFLTIHDIVSEARRLGILCQGRGSAANSAVCYVLGITAVDPAQHDLLFARFISTERKEPPDIDVDFEHERREEIIQYIYNKYGRHRAGIAGTVITYRPRSAIREVGKVLGLTDDITGRLAGTVWGGWGREIGEKHVAQSGLAAENPTIALAVELASRIGGFPRHLSQHVGGFVLTRGRLDEMVPIGNAAMPDRTFIEWDKDDIDTLGLLKVDILALGMLSCIRKAFALLGEHCDLPLELASVPKEDPAVYAMLQKGDSIGVFQVESRAQINMLPRLKPREFFDLVIQVAIVRPGPIQGDMVHPYLRRRSGLEQVFFPSPSPQHGPPDELYHVLNRTLGVPLFQEQAMKLAMVAAKFTDVEANQLRRAMATFRNVGTIHKFEALMVERMVARGYERDFAQRCFEQIKGFGSYGFPESHAASFAKLVYISSWIKCHHPAVFACALLNSQPMGFYAPAQIVRDAAEHGVPIRPIDVNHSQWDNQLERTETGVLALRLGFRQVDGLHESWAQHLVAARSAPFDGVEHLWRSAKVPQRALKLLAEADAFRSLGLDRRDSLWAISRLPDDAPLPLFAAANARELGGEPEPELSPMPLSEHVVTDYQTFGLSLKAHPMAFLRDECAREGIASCLSIVNGPDGAFVRGAGLVLVRQRPGKGNAIFLTLEDDTGITNVVLWARTFEHFRREVMSSRLLQVEGRVQKSVEGVVHLMASRVIDRTGWLKLLSEDRPVPVSLARADEILRPQHPRGLSNHPRNIRSLPKSRDFH